MSAWKKADPDVLPTARHSTIISDGQGNSQVVNSDFGAIDGEPIVVDLSPHIKLGTNCEECAEMFRRMTTVWEHNQRHDAHHKGSGGYLEGAYSFIYFICCQLKEQGMMPSDIIKMVKAVMLDLSENTYSYEEFMRTGQMKRHKE